MLEEVFDVVESVDRLDEGGMILVSRDEPRVLARALPVREELAGERLAATEAFTHMRAHWCAYPAALKPDADATADQISIGYTDDGMLYEIFQNLGRLRAEGVNVLGMLHAEDADILREEYRRQRDVASLQGLIRSVSNLAIWDDHDFGRNIVPKMLGETRVIALSSRRKVFCHMSGPSEAIANLPPLIARLQI